MSNRRNKNASDIADAYIEDPQPRKKRWLLRFCVVTLTVLLLLILLAPTILTQAAVRDYALAKVWPAEAGVLSMRSMQVGWFRPLTVEGVRVLDRQGNPLLEVAKIEGDRSIFQLAKDYSDMGTLVVTDPTVNLLLRADGSNLEDTLAALVPASDTEQAPSTEPAEPLAIAAHLKLVNAQVVATEVATKTTWRIDKVNAEANLPKALDADWKLQVAGAVDGAPFDLQASTPMGLATAVWPMGPQGTAQLECTSLPLQPLQYAAMRAGQPMEELAGNLTLNTKVDWQPEANSELPRLTAKSIVNANDLSVRSQALLGRDHLVLRDTRLLTTLDLAGSVLSLHQCDVVSDFGSASLATTVDLNQYQDTAQIVNAIRRQQLSSTGQIDIAQLTRTLPHMLKIRDDVQVGNGRVAWNVQSQVTAGSPTRWDGTLQTQDVQLLKNGQPMDWQFPLEVRFAAVDGEEIELENFLARSDFFSFSGQGKLRAGNLQGQADLEKLVYQLGQVIDMQGMYVAGKMQTSLSWSETQTDQLKLDGRTKFTQFVMAQHEQLLCRENELTVATVATASLAGQEVASLDSARVDVIAGNDFLAAQLQSAVAKPSAESNWPVACRLRGDVGAWLARLKPFGVGLEWKASGQVDATAQLTANQAGAAIHSLDADIRQFTAQTEGMLIDEPVVQVKTAGAVDFNTLACNFPSTTVASKSLSIAAQNVDVKTTPHFVVAGDVGYKVDIARLMATMPSESTQTISGVAAGQLRLNAEETTTRFRISGNVQDLQVEDSTQAKPLWHEPELTMQVSGAYDAVQDVLQLAQAEVVGKVLNLAAQGSAGQLMSTSPVVDVAGQYGYNLDGLMAIFGEMLGSDIRITGQQTQPFAARGPVFPSEPNSQALVANELTAQAGLGWDAADVYSLPLGAGQIDAQLSGGLLRTAPIQLAIGDGRINLSPSINVNSPMLDMTLDSGVVLEQVRITPQMTSTWMKYIAPLLADATNAEGTFSVALSHAQVPLMDPTLGNVEGDFAIHGGALGPGPLATQFLELATQIKRLTGKGDSRIADPTKTWIELKPQEIHFRLADQRVYHEGFTMVIDGVTIQTRGSVGVVEDNLDVIADVPILDEWIAGNSALAGLKGKVISIPVRGTTSKPQLDRGALTQLSGQLVQEAARGYLQKELGSKIQDKLLGGKLKDVLGDAADNPQEALGNKLQEEFSRGLNKLFK